MGGSGQVRHGESPQLICCSSAGSSASCGQIIVSSKEMDFSQALLSNLGLAAVNGFFACNLSGKDMSLFPLCSAAVAWLQSSRLGPQSHRTSSAPGCHHLLQQGQPDFSPFLNFCNINQPSWLILLQFYCSKLDFKGN